MMENRWLWGYQGEAKDGPKDMKRIRMHAEKPYPSQPSVM